MWSVFVALLQVGLVTFYAVSNMRLTRRLENREFERDCLAAILRREFHTNVMFTHKWTWTSVERDMYVTTGHDSVQ